MALKKMTCPHCHGKVDIDLSKDTNIVACSYCGQTLTFEDNHQRKTININKRITDDAAVIRAQSDAEEKKRDNKTALWIMGGMTLFIVIMFMSAYISHIIHISKLEDLVVEVQELIDDGEFDKARVKAAKIVDDSDWSEDSEKKWNRIRKELVKQIDEAEVEAKKLAILDAWAQKGKD